MGTNTRPLHVIAAVTAAITSFALFVDDDGTAVTGIALAAVAVAWWFAPAWTPGERPGRGVVVRLAAMLSIAASLAVLILLLAT